MYGFLIVVCLFNLLKSIGQPNQTEFDNYITISNGQFWDGNSHFYPVCVNYLVEYLSDSSDPYSPVYYISPLLSYSNIKRYHYDTFRHGFPVDTSEHWGYGNDGTTERDSAGIKLENDLRRMDSLGFNVVRLAPTASWTDTYPYRANLHVGNFDSDRADELLGINSWATKFDLNSSNQWNWSWSTYESGRLSDWTVNPAHRIFFMKTMTDVPDYMFVGRWIPNNYFRFDGYSFDP